MSRKHSLYWVAYAAMIATVVFGAACVKSTPESTQGLVDWIESSRLNHNDVIAEIVKHHKETDSPEEFAAFGRKVAKITTGRILLQDAEIALVAAINLRGENRDAAISDTHHQAKAALKRVKFLVSQIEIKGDDAPLHRAVIRLGLARIERRISKRINGLKETPGEAVGEDIVVVSPVNFPAWYRDLATSYGLPPLASVELGGE